MRATMPFDTHAYIKKLVAAGMPEAQAEVQAEALADIALANLATKDDLRIGMDQLRAAMDQLRSDIRADMKDLEIKLTLRLGAMPVASMGILVAILKLT